jgi:CheY-like chemotaxis protein
VTRSSIEHRKQARRILIVDDDCDVADALSSLLRSLGHEVEVAYDAQSALSTARSAQPQIAILDLAMPDMNGYELARQLREMLQELRLFAMSGFSSEQSRTGFECVLTKPPDIEALIESLDCEPAEPRDRYRQIGSD